VNDGIDDDERGERFVAFDCVVAFGCGEFALGV
jgi:hypothetical protein